MKKALFFCLVFTSIVWLSCKKDNHTKTEPQGKLRPIAFNVSSFTQQNTPIDQSAKVKVNAVTPDATNIKWLIYKLYNSSNALTKTVVTRKGHPGFGTIKDSLAAGNYTAVFVGVTDTLHFYNGGDHFGYVDYDIRDGDLPFSETFYKKVSFTVGSTNFQQNVELLRLNSQLQVVIKDAIPPGVAMISVYTSVDEYYYYFNDKSYNPSIPISSSVAISANLIGTNNLTLGPVGDILATDRTCVIKIVAMDRKYGIIAQKTINVQFKRNTLTILTGNLFINDPTTGGFVIGFEPYNPVGLTQTF